MSISFTWWCGMLPFQVGVYFYFLRPFWRQLDYKPFVLEGRGVVFSHSHTHTHYLVISWYMILGITTLLFLISKEFRICVYLVS
jgi:hypothetical protein